MKEQNKQKPEKPREFWNVVYFAVVVNTFIVVTALWAFSVYFR